MTTIEYNGKTYTDDDILSGECYIARSLLSSTLEIETFEFSLYSEDTSLVNFNPDSVIVFRNDGKRIKTFYLQEVKRSGKYVYDFYAVSVAGILDKRNYYGGIYSGQTVGTVVRDIFGSIPVSISSDVINIKLYGWLPVSTRREALAQVLFATSAALIEDSSGNYSIAGLSPEQKRVVSENETSYDASIEYTTSAIDVVVVEHQYTEGTDEVTLFEGTANNGDVITFSEPCHSLVASGFSITQQGANYAVVTSGSGKLTGRKYIHSTREVKGNPTIRTPSDDAHRVRVEDATLVSLVNSRAVADRLSDYYARSERIVSDITYKDDNAGDVLSQYHPYNETMVQTCVESLDITLSGKLLAKTSSLVGYIPPDISQIEYYDTYQILTGSGTWTPPKGTKNLRAVLIGGGQGGQSGVNGRVGDLADQTNPGVTIYATKYGLGGDGGAGGESGTPGKVYQTDINVLPGKSYSYNCGYPGSGGVSDGTENPVIGAIGGDTVFDSYNSAYGSVPTGGFYNPLDGNTYAVQGVRGIDGAKGGNGGYFDQDDWQQFNIKGLPGESLGDAPGGLGAKGYWGRETSARAGGGGGGAAYKAPGGNGTEGKPYDYNNEWGHGGNGGSPAKPSKPNYGSAGNGGHGGGGAGGGGGYIADRGRTTRNAYYSTNSTRRPEVTQGTPGIGSQGGDGGDGCVILFYSLPRK